MTSKPTPTTSEAGERVFGKYTEAGLREWATRAKHDGNQHMSDLQATDVLAMLDCIDVLARAPEPNERVEGPRWETGSCNCAEPPFESETMHDMNLVPRCPRCNVALGGSIIDPNDEPDAPPPPAALAEREKLVEALRPFAAEADVFDSGEPTVRYDDSYELWQGCRTTINVGDLRRARTAISEGD
jgi:hypothetical protein